MQKRNLSLIAVFLICGLTMDGPTHGDDRICFGSDDSPSTENVLLIVSDDLRANTLGCYGDNLARTPHLDRLAKGGMVFDYAYCQGTWCAPSRRSFMHSRYVDSACPTLGETLRSASISSIRVSKIFHMRVPGDIVDGTNGEDVAACWNERFNSQGDEAHTVGAYACLNQNIFTNAMEGRQGARTAHRAFVTVQVEGDASNQPDCKSASKTIELIKRLHDQQFFLAVGLVRPHYPMVAPQSMFEHFPSDTMELPSTWNQDLTTSGIPAAGQPNGRSAQNGIGRYPLNQKKMWSGYRASVEFMDAQVGRILDELDRQGLAETTTVIFTSDHGYHLGDHTFWQKSNLHENVARVPLIIRQGTGSKTNPTDDNKSVNANSPRRSQSLVELVDLYPTICELMSVATPEACQGKSLVPVLADPSATVRDATITIDGNNKTRHFLLRTKRWAYMRYQDGSAELYDMQQDPEQLNNLTSNPQHDATRSRLDQQLNALISSGKLDASS